MKSGTGLHSFYCFSPRLFPIKTITDVVDDMSDLAFLWMLTEWFRWVAIFGSDAF